MDASKQFWVSEDLLEHLPMLDLTTLEAIASASLLVVSLHRVPVENYLADFFPLREYPYYLATTHRFNVCIIAKDVLQDH